MFSKIRSRIVPDIGIDLGAMNMRVFVKGKGVALEVPTVVALQTGTKRVFAVGEESKDMLGRTPGNIVAVRPMMSGMIADYDLTEALLRFVFGKVFVRRWWRRLIKPRAVITVPSGITEVEKYAVEMAAHAAGAGDVFLIERSIAAAIGAGLPVSEPSGCMIVEIGASTCEVAIISLAGIVHSCCLPTAGDAMTASIVDYFHRQKLAIGERDADAIKTTIGSACPTESEQIMEVNGRDSETGKPKVLKVTAEEVREALKTSVSAIVKAVRETIARCEPDLYNGLMESGFVLSGGGSLLRGLDELLARETGLKVVRAENPLTSTVEGTGVVLDEIDFLVKNRRKCSGTSAEM